MKDITEIVKELYSSDDTIDKAYLCNTILVKSKDGYYTLLLNIDGQLYTDSSGFEKVGQGHDTHMSIFKKIIRKSKLEEIDSND